MHSAKTFDYAIRWLIRRDMPEVLKIEQECFEFPWTNEDFLFCLRQRNCIGMVAQEVPGPNFNVYERNDYPVLGYMIYELHREKLNLLNIAVDVERRRDGIGAAMIERLVTKLSQQRREEITTRVREGNLQGQLFFRSQGFLAIGVESDAYDDTDEDAYLLSFLLPSAYEPA